MTTVRDVLQQIDEVSVVTPRDIAQSARMTYDEAAAALEHLPLDNARGVYALSGGLAEALNRVESEGHDPDMPIRSFLLKVDPDADSIAGFETRVHRELEGINERLGRIEGLLTKPPTRRRKHGELFEPHPDDPEDLARMRREAAAEVAQAKRTGLASEKKRVYAKWFQRIAAIEKRRGLGIHSKE